MMIGWEALAFVFAIMPAIVALVYCYECGLKTKTPSVSEYFKLLKFTEKAKKESYQDVAQLFGYGKSPVFYVGLLAWLFSVIVSLLSPNFWVVLACFVVSIPASFIAYLIGRRQRDKHQ
jgi:hypothetical protein